MPDAMISGSLCVRRGSPSKSVLNGWSKGFLIQVRWQPGHQQPRFCLPTNGQSENDPCAVPSEAG
jgi:hypothetical protein